MPELRKDPIIGRWVIISTERSKRPDQFSGYDKGPKEGKCPFCEGSEYDTPPEICAVRLNHTQPNTPGWQVRVVPSIKPLLRTERSLERQGKGLFDTLNGIGIHEVVIETPEHIANIADLSIDQITKIIDAYIARFKAIEKDGRLRYLLVFKNYGWAAGGGRIGHSRSQLIATPVNPKRVKEELVGSRKYFEYHERCVFCDLIKQELEFKQRVILDIDGLIAIVPFASRFPFEVWILPKQHSCDFNTISMPHQKDLARILKIVMAKLKKGLSDPPYNYIIHTAPFRRPKLGYWKTIEQDYHWHIEIMPKLTRVAGFEWGTGFYICPLPPEDAAEFLRGVKVG